MANSFWNFVLQLVPGTLARAEDVNDNLTGVQTGFDRTEEELSKAVQITNDPGTVDISSTPAVRANKFLQFDASGNVVLGTTVGSWRGDHANSAGTAYYVRDVVRDSTGALGQDNLYICSADHLSTGSLDDDVANWDLMINVVDVYTAQTAAETAQTAAEAAQAAAELAYDNFDDRYLGEKTSEPTLDNDGNALITGAMFFHSSTVNRMKVWNGTSWQLSTAAAVDVSVSDSGGYFDDSNVEAVLQDVGSRIDIMERRGKNVLVNAALTEWIYDTTAPITNGASNLFDGVWPYYLGDSAGGTGTWSQQSDVPAVEKGAAPYFSMRIDVTATATLNSGAEAGVYHGVEGYDLWNCITDGADYATLSFWVKSNKTGLYAVSFHNDNGHATRRTYIGTYTINAANTWEYKTVTIPTSEFQTGNWYHDERQGCYIYWTVRSGSATKATPGQWNTGNLFGVTGQVDLWDSTSNYWMMAAPVFERGLIALPFPSQTKQYYEAEMGRRIEILHANDGDVWRRFGNGNQRSTTLADIIVPFQYEKMRDPHTAAISTASSLAWYTLGSVRGPTSRSVHTITKHNVCVTLTIPAYGAAGNAGFMIANNNQTAYVFADCGYV